MANLLIFDSGVGGLSVTENIRQALPELHIDYVADDEFRPYGNKTAAQLKARLPELLRILEIMLKPDIIVLACNTASTSALNEIRAIVHCPVIGVVPAIKPAAHNSQSKTIAVLGTPGTVSRKYVGKLINDYAKSCKVILHGSTKLVEIAENKLEGKGVDLDAVKSELSPIIANPEIDTIVLACTHFPLLLEELKKSLAKDVNWIESGPAIARRTQHLLQEIPTRKNTAKRENIAFSIGGDMPSKRQSMFAHYGFERFVIL